MMNKLIVAQANVVTGYGSWSPLILKTQLQL